MTQITDALGQITCYTWCGCGRLETLTDALGNVTRFSHDLQGRLTAKRYADNQGVDYFYENTTSRLESRIDALDQTTQYHYAQDDFVSDITYANSRNSTADRHFHYDAAYHRLTAFDNGQGQTTLSYVPAGHPGAGRLAQETAPDGYRIERNYDMLGRLQTNTVVDPGNTSYPNTLDYDVLGRPIENATGLGSFQYAYDHDSPRLTQLIYPNQTRESFVYHDITADLRLKTLNHYRPDGKLFANHRYSYDAEGQISQWQRQDPTTVREHYQYDAIGQLLQVGGATFYIPAIPAIPQGDGQPPIPAVPAHRLDNVTLAYAYDAAGNRIRETIDSQSAAAYNNLNQLLTNGNDSYSHDLEGNQSERQSPTLGNRRTLWDAENRLIAVEDPQNPTMRNDFQYDALGRRIGVQDKNNGTLSPGQSRLNFNYLKSI